MQGRTLPAQKLRLLRALTSKRGQVVETRKRLLAQVKAQGKLGMADLLDDLDNTLKTALMVWIFPTMIALQARDVSFVAFQRTKIVDLDRRFPGHMIRKGQLAQTRIPAFKQFAALAA